jgi:hypothetical protein
MFRVSTIGLGLVLAVAAFDSGHAGDRWTWIDPGNDARIADYVGQPGGSVCVKAVDAVTRQPARVRLWRDADPGRKKDLDYMFGQRTLTTKGLRYSVFVHNTTGRPIFAAPCEASVITIPIIRAEF